MPAPVIAIIGRPNVGKSTLFNRLIGRRQAIVHDMPGMTRDRHYGKADHGGRPFIVIDTGGYEDSTNSPMLGLMREQTLIAIEEADTILFLCEEGVANDPIDGEILQRLRASQKPFFLVVNKTDSSKRAIQAIADFSIHGVDEVFPVSALHGDGVLDLMDEVVKVLPPGGSLEEAEDGSTRVAIVGRVNVGKSTLVNRLLGENRVIASDIPGTTRDAIDTRVTVHGEPFVLIDTAGIRRRGRIERGAEKLSVHSSFRAIDRCHVALLLVDATEGASAQDAHIAGYLLDSGKACVIVLNKWDAVADRENYGEHIKRVREDFKFLKWAPVITISARTGQRASKLWSLVRHCNAQHARQFPTSELNRILRMATSYVSPPIGKGRQLKLKYVTQTGSRPPQFTFFVNDPEIVHFSYERYLENQFRAALDLDGTPLQLRFRRKADNWVEKKLDEAKQSGAAGASGALRQPRVIHIGEDEDYEAEVFDEDGAEEEAEDGGHEGGEE